MIKTKLDMLFLIGCLRETDRYIQDIYTMGSCYRFHLFLNKMTLGKCEPMITQDKGHIVTKFKGSFYDITGEVFGHFEPLSKSELQKAKGWSFYKQMCLSIGECPACDEPIIF